ncbi:sugar kinase [Spirosoma utsteinense]|uniref:2-dehydro-3-deoxygluconokinase n=1 Tax=Spirosoma utsteinense TaxID=2585773 RepID=A0ABR6W281_9BACT|nr:sugar kinase [Spirosoma utsteinense]MBC3786005.1 2-dehydro-3-deoxygluconokinase [Spirosoma utsteinense]MBC3790703.1 2-dehydro-3-deoxygluconokinase [Spirosoma utsteinense]
MKLITFGEVMLRLSPTGVDRLTQSSTLTMHFGGTEANVAVSMAQFGVPVAHVSRFPNHAIGQAAAGYLRRYGVDTQSVRFGDGRMGLYFLETGAGTRASQIIYDRVDSAFSRIKPDEIDWESILAGTPESPVSWFHWTGITPALSQGAADCLLAGIQTANRLGIPVSGDIVYRSNLWQYGRSPKEIMPALTEGCTLVLGSKSLFSELYGVVGSTFQEAGRALMQRFPNIRYVTDTKRNSVSASHNQLSAKLFDGETVYKSRLYDIQPIVDRIGTGDAYMAGLIYGLLTFNDPQRAVEFGAAASALKHTIAGDVNLATVAEVETLERGDGSGRLKR